MNALIETANLIEQLTEYMKTNKVVKFKEEDEPIERRVARAASKTTTPDEELMEKAMRKKPAMTGTGDRKYPGYDGIWGEWIASERRWTDGMFFVSAIRGFQPTKRMSFSKAWTIRCLRMGKI